MYPAFLDDERQIAPARAVRTQFDDGSFTLRSPMALQPYARCVGESLERWAKETPDALALAERSDGAEGWRSLTYAQLRRQVGAVAQSLLDLRLIVDSMDAQSDNLAMRLARLRYRLEPALQRKGLVLHWQLTDPELGVGQQTTLPLPRDRVAHEILAVVQAGISNAIEHAHATEMWLTLEPYQQGDLQSFGWDWYLSIEDNGKGFDLQAVLDNPSKSGHGVNNMFHRMRSIGGDLHIHPRHG